MTQRTHRPVSGSPGRGSQPRRRADAARGSTLLGALLMVGACGLIEHRPNDESGAAADEGAEAGDSPAAKTDKLATLGYLGATRVDEKDVMKTGVTLHERSAQVGRLVWTSNGWGPGFWDVPGQIARRQAVLMEADGTELHRWEGPKELAGPPNKPNGWANVVLADDGSLFVVDFMTRVLKVGWDSEVLWEHPGRYHHDLDLDLDGNVVTLTSEEIETEFQGEKLWIWDDIFDVYDAKTGKRLHRIPVHDKVQKIDGFEEIFADVIKRRRRRHKARSDLDAMAKKASLDTYHTNTVHVLRKPLEGVWEAGDILTCYRNISTLAVMDKDDGHIKWSWGNGELDHPHDPSFLDNGNILVFDNRPSKGASRIVEFDPKTKEIVWTYESDGEKFYSSIRGQVTRLDGGNTLIIDSQRGRLFEVTPDGDLVWEYYSPDTFMRTGDGSRKGKRGKRGKRGKKGKNKKVMMRVPIRAATVGSKASDAATRLLAEPDAG
jgi:hypothetical protein